MPTGRPSSPKPIGTATAGRPVTFHNAIVRAATSGHVVATPATGRSTSSNAGAVWTQAGATTTSHPAIAA
jgi:hypothetical protein